jgi:hypothetical protein
MDIRDVLLAERKRIDAALAALGESVSTAVKTAVRRGKKKLSAAARAKISAAQKLRWSKVKAAKK